MAVIDERLDPLVNQIFEENNQISTPKIQRVPAFLHQNPDFVKYCSPKIISFGPIHHQNENLRLGQQFKTQWTSLYFREYYGANTATRAHAAAQSLLNTVEGGIQDLRQLFTEDLTAVYSDRELSWMLLVDGCSLLYYLEHVDDHCPEELMLKLDQLMYIWRDITLLENQLPMRLLELLSKTQGPNLWYLLANFNSMGEAKRNRWRIDAPPGVPYPIHILDFARSFFNGLEGRNNVENNVGNQQGGVDGNQQAGAVENANNVRNSAGNQQGGAHGDQQDGVDIENPNNVRNNAENQQDGAHGDQQDGVDIENQQGGAHGDQQGGVDIENPNNVRNNAGNQQGGAHGNQQDGVDIENPNNVRNNVENQQGGVHGNHQDGVDIRNRNNVANQNDGHGPPPEAEQWLSPTYKNIRDLKKAGIRVKANKTQEWIWHNISFTSKWFSGELRLPVYLFNDVTPYFFRNLVAYELCPDFRNNFECCSFFSFMDSLIDDAEDVKELRLAGVFQNLLGTDEEVAKLFNEIGHDLPTKMFNVRRTNSVAYSEKYIQVKRQIEMHYSNKCKTWLAEFRNTHFNSPWSVLAFLAALLALVLTFIQTWYAIHPKENNVSNKVTM